MGVFTTFSCPIEAIPQGVALDAAGGSRIELEPVVPVEGSVMPFFRVWDADLDTFERRLDEFQVVEQLHRIAETDESVLYRVRWAPDVDGLVDAVAGTDAALLDANGTNEGWQLEIRFADDDAVSAFRSRCEERDVPIQLHRIAPLESRERSDRLLTAKQRETLRRAYEWGYFDDPRGTTMGDLAESFGVSPRAVSQRMRRGFRRMIESDVLEG